MRHVYECSVRFDDLDAFGHVNNVTFAEYLQEARIDFAHQYLNYTDGPDESSVVVHQLIDYVAPVPFRSEPLQVHVWVSHVGTSSFHLAYEVKDATTVFARATGVLVAYDTDGDGPRPLSDAERGVLESFREAKE